MSESQDRVQKPNLFHDFFETFSRFEFALKASGYCEGKEDKRAKPNWNKFFKDAEWFEPQAPSICCAVEYLCAEPPQEQIVKNEGLDWNPLFSSIEYKDLPKGTESAKKILKAVKTIRNNLFHGGKYIPQESLSPGNNMRDRKLVEASLIVLHYCLDHDCNKELKEAFDSGCSPGGDSPSRINP